MQQQHSTPSCTVFLVSWSVIDLSSGLSIFETFVICQLVKLPQNEHLIGFILFFWLLFSVSVLLSGSVSVKE